MLRVKPNSRPVTQAQLATNYTDRFLRARRFKGPLLGIWHQSLTFLVTDSLECFADCTITTDSWYRV